MPSSVPEDAKAEPSSTVESAVGEDAAGPRSRDRTRARILQAAYEVFAENGLDGASVEAICDRAGFTRGAFYSNFTSKDELFLELARVVTDRKLDGVNLRVEDLRAQREDSAPVPSPVELVHHVLDGTVEDRFGVVLMAEIRLRAMRDETAARAYREWEQSLVERVEKIISQLASAYGFGLRMPAPDFARLMLTVWESSLASAVIDRLDYDARCRLAAARAEQLALALVETPA
jgi:AcrR family transcriptional regulator